jgi:hypothetical protein
VYGGFTYTTATHEARLAPIELSVKDKETVNVPVWAGVETNLGGCDPAPHAQLSATIRF